MPAVAAVAGDELFVNGIENGSLGNGVTASWNATTDTLTLSGTASISVYDTLLSEITFQDTGTDTSSGSHPVRTVTWTINDGTNSYNATSTIDRRPSSGCRQQHRDGCRRDHAIDDSGQRRAVERFRSRRRQPDGHQRQRYRARRGHRGIVSCRHVWPSDAQCQRLVLLRCRQYGGDQQRSDRHPSSGHFSYTVSDGNGGTTSASLTITLDRAPVVTASNVTLSVGHTSVAASSLFSATDPDGNAITTYAFEDTGSGHFVLNGVVEPNNQEIDVTAAQLSQLTYQGVAGSTTDTVEVRVNDGTLWSSWTSFTVTPPPL